MASDLQQEQKSHGPWFMERNTRLDRRSQKSPQESASHLDVVFIAVTMKTQHDRVTTAQQQRGCLSLKLQEMMTSHRAEDDPRPNLVQSETI